MNSGKNFTFGEDESFDLDLSEQKDIGSDDIEFGGCNALLGLEDDQEFQDNSDPEFDESSLDLGILDIDPQDQIDQPDELTTSEQVIDAMVCHMSSNPNIVTSLSKGVTAAKLDMIGSAINANLETMYASDEMVNIAVNGIAQGLIVGERFEKTVPNSIKMFYVPAKRTDSIHMHKVAGTSMSTYKATPALTSFDEKAINTLTAVFKDKIIGFDTLCNYLKDTCHKPVSKAVSNDNSSYLAMDNGDIAKGLAKSKLSIEQGVARLTRIGCDKSRITKIAVLAKAIRDSK